MKNNGGSAFPQVKTDKQYTTDPDVHSVGGMTLRDYFAAKAMSGFCASESMIDSNDSRAISYVADVAYAMADAMLAAREAE